MTLALEERGVVHLEPAPPFNFDATFHKPDHFPSTDNRWQPGIRWQTMRWGGRLAGLRIENAGSVDRPAVRLGVWLAEDPAPGFLDALAAEVSYRASLGLDLTVFERRFRDDPQLGPAIARWRGMRPATYTSLYEYLVIAIVLQNATVRRSVAMLDTLFARYGARVAFDEQEFSAFWEPEVLAAAPEDELRQARVGYRARALHRMSRAFACGDLDELSLRNEPLGAQRRTLLGLYGIGPASVGYILGDVFHHLDELSHVPPWEQRIYSVLFFGTGPDEPVPVGRLLDLFRQRFTG